MLCSDALVEILDADDFATKAVDLFSDFLPALNPPSGILHAVYEEMSSSWNAYAGPVSAATARIQFITRAGASQYDEGAEASTQLYHKLCSLEQRDVTVTLHQTPRLVRLLGVVVSYPPFLVRRDDEDRPLFTFDALVTWSLPQ